MAGVLGPGGRVPKPISKPTGVIRSNISPSASTRRLGKIATNLEDELARNQGISGYQQSWEYGPTIINQNVVLSESNKQAFGRDVYLEYLDPDLVNRKFEFQGEGAGLADGGTYDGAQTPAVGEYDIPTSTSNFKRPRTLAAGYDPNEGTVTVVFRDGTFYNYYGISAGTWSIFKESYSKGPLLNGGNTERKKKGTQDGLLLRECSARGEADLSQLGEEAKNFFVTVARSAQIALRSSSARTKSGQFAKKKGPGKGLIGSSQKARVSASVNVSAAKRASSGGKNRPTANKAN